MSDNPFQINVISDAARTALDTLPAQGQNLRPALLDWAEWAKGETDLRFAEQAD